MWPSLNAAYSLSVHSEAVLATFTTFQHHFNICTRNAGPALKQALHHSECFTHRNTNGSKSACGHFKKKKLALANQSRHCGRNIRCLSHVFSSVTSPCHFPATSFSPLHFPMWICEKHLPKWTESQSVCKTPYSDGNKMSQKSMEETSLQIGPLWALIFVIHFN